MMYNMFGMGVEQRLLPKDINTFVLDRSDRLGHVFYQEDLLLDEYGKQFGRKRVDLSAIAEVAPCHVNIDVFLGGMDRVAKALEAEMRATGEQGEKLLESVLLEHHRPTSK